MKVCYADESGTHAGADCLVMVGIIADLHRVGPTRREFSLILGDLNSLYPGGLRELKGQKLLAGSDGWRQLDPTLRKAIAQLLCGWVSDRKHTLALAAVDKAAHKKAGAPIPEVNDPWVAAALHLTLQVQRAHGRLKGGKGATMFVLDEGRDVAALNSVLWEPTDWPCSYYGGQAGRGSLGQLFDVAFTVKSGHAGLVQVADLYAAVFRRYAELESGGEEDFKGEGHLFRGYVGQLKKRLIPRADRWPKNVGCQCAQWYRSVAPAPLLNL
ncbi:MAG: DUF3800 domain-containing protein [Terriglobales bacterium]